MLSAIIPISDHDLYLADIGSKRHLLLLSSAINSMDYVPDRILIAYKWAFISSLMEFEEAKYAVDYLRKSMSDQQVDAADRLVDVWLDRKFEEFNTNGRQEFAEELIAILSERQV